MWVFFYNIPGGSLVKLAYYSTVTKKRALILESNKVRLLSLFIITVEPGISSHSYEQPTSHGRPPGHSPK